jgi:hypothetical protein
MSPDEIRDLWSRFLAGEELSPESQKSLVDALDADRELRESLLENLQLDGVLHAMGATRRDGEAFVRNLSECLAPERDATRFIKKVESRLNENPPPTWTPPATGRKTKKDTTRVFRRRSASSTSGETAWKPALIAAAAFITILLLVTSSPKEPRRTVVKAPPAPLFTPEQPPTPPQIPERREAPPSQTTKVEMPRETPRIAPPVAPENPAKPELTPEERQRIDEELKKSRMPSRVPKMESAPGTSALVSAPTATVIERFEGLVYVVRGKATTLAKKDELLDPGNTVYTYPNGSARIRFNDDTWIDLGPSSSLREEAAPSTGKGRVIYLANGTLESKITRQSPDQPMIFRTPTGEATILGTTIRLTVSQDPKLGTTLEVKEGKVRLKNLLNGKTAEVLTDQFAVAASGVDPLPRKVFPDEVLVKFGPSDVQLQPGWVLDSGDEYDPTRGYGWKGPKNGPAIAGLFWLNPATNQLEPKHAGRGTTRRGVPPGTDPLKATDVNAGWMGQTETWFMPIPNGRYLVSVCCGDLTVDQGPHHVWVEGYQLINERRNKVGESIEVKDFQIDVRDGELTMVVGGFQSKKVSSDLSSDTIINYLLIKRVRK